MKKKKNMKWNDAHHVQPEPNKILLFMTTSENLIMYGHFTKHAGMGENYMGTFTGIDTKDSGKWGRPISTGYNLWANNEYEVTHWIYLVDIIPHIEFPET